MWMNNTIKLVFLALSISLLSACAAPPKTVFVPLSGVSTASISPNKKLHVTVSNQLPGASKLGGEDGWNTVKFQGVLPWLRGHLSVLNNVRCPLKKKLDLRVSVDKLYVAEDTDTLVGNIELVGRYRINGQPSTVHYYRGECEARFLWSNERWELSRCLTSALSQITAKMSVDICRQAG